MSKNKKIKKVSKKTSVKKKKRRAKIIKWTGLFILVIGMLTLILLSDVFNIKEINVLNNNRITNEEIIKLSEIKINENMFKFLKFKAKDNIKTNPYIESVKIHRKWNKTIEIDVEERVPMYMLSNEGKFLYINNQGYILEESDEKIEKPIIEGFETQELKPGDRLGISDLKKLNNIIKIMQSATTRNIADKITGINIESSLNIIVQMENEQKTIYFGDDTKIDDKIIKIIPVLEDNVGVSGEIFVQDINKIYFRGDV